MGRRRKCRFVADVPAVTVFKPQGVPMGQLYGVAIGLDGFEALRLVDAEGLSQEEAAARMGVSRPTLCRILGEARTLVARALTRGWAIRVEIDGGHAVTGGEFSEATAPAGRRARGCAGGPGRNQGGRSCLGREDKVVLDKAVLDKAAGDREGEDRAADAGGAVPADAGR
jgi:predicted DNA-binding protein (UPF0251 family)